MILRYDCSTWNIEASMMNAERQLPGTSPDKVTDREQMLAYLRRVYDVAVNFRR